jgi:tRNA1(Val) A37 N6-methylase TrmN6
MTTPEAGPGLDETLDSFYHGRIRIIQKKRGYRFSVDAPLLADFIPTRPGEELLEVGTGCGVIALLLSLKPFRSLLALEVQPELADLARRNVALNGLADRIAVVEGDIRAFAPGRRFDVVFSNPPYVRARGGHLSRSPQRSAAKHELAGTISDIMRRTRELLREEGRAYFIFPERRRQDLMTAAKAADLGLRALRPVLPRAAEAANLVLVELAPGVGAGAATTLPPLVLFGADGAYTPEAERVFAGRTEP